LGIGEMLQPDNVIGFGDHMPDFMTHAVPQIVSRNVAKDDDDGAED
jgi:hypothetical protein